MVIIECPSLPCIPGNAILKRCLVAAMMFLDNIGFVANMVSMVLYFMFVMKFDLSGSSTTTTNYLGTVFLLTLVGGIVSDTYMTRLNTALVFGAIELAVTFPHACFLNTVSVKKKLGPIT